MSEVAYKPTGKVQFNTCTNGNCFKPTHLMVRHLVFPPIEGDSFDPSVDEVSEAELQAHFVDALSRLASKNGLNANDIQNLTPGILRMIKSRGPWVK